MIRAVSCLLFFVTLTIFSQDTIPRYWVGFSTKSSTTFNINNPNAYLSQRAIERRINQAIAIDSLDLPVNENFIATILSAGDFTLWATSKWLNGIIIKTLDTLALDSLVNFPFVAGYSQVKSKINVDVNEKHFKLNAEKANLLSIDNTPHYPFGVSYYQHHLHGADLVQQLGFNGRGIHIAVLDAGFNKANQTPALVHLYDENRVLSTYDFVRKESSVYEDNYHGEAVLSIIAAYDPGYYVGSAPMASFHLLVSEDVFSESLVEEYYWVVAAEYADSAGVDIINTSLGYTLFDDSTTNHTYADMDGQSTIAAKGLNIAALKGVLCVSSAGNSGSSNWKYISTPADADYGFTVGAVDSNGLRADFSSQGPAFDGAIKPNVMAVGWNTYFIGPQSILADQGNGTSFSAPMMTGMLATLWEAMPELTNFELMELVEQYSHKALSPDSLMGYGIPNMNRLLLENTNNSSFFDPIQKIKNIYPNPFKVDFDVLYAAETQQELTVEMFSITGALLFANTYSIIEGLNRLHIYETAKLSSGAYILKIGQEQHKIIKLE